MNVVTLKELQSEPASINVHDPSTHNLPSDGLRGHPAGRAEGARDDQEDPRTASRLCARVALVAGPAQAGSTLAVSLVPNFALPVSCPGDGFGLDVNSLAGRPLGTGQTCIAVDRGGCDPFTAFCRQTVRSTLTLDLARGSLTVPLKLLEVCPTQARSSSSAAAKWRPARAPMRPLAGTLAAVAGRSTTRATSPAGSSTSPTWGSDDRSQPPSERHRSQAWSAMKPQTGWNW